MTATVTGIAINTHEPTPCIYVQSTAPATATGAAIGGHECVACAVNEASAPATATAVAINAYEIDACALALWLTPNVGVDALEATDLVYSVWSENGVLALDNATVDLVVSDANSTTILTKSTDDYSIITFGNTLVVHLDSGDLTVIDTATLNYTFTITI